MSLITIEDQSPIMRRAKIRVAVAIALLTVTAGSFLLLNEQAPSLPVNTKTSQTPAAAAKPGLAVTPPVQGTPAPAAGELAAKPPVAPPDPVYTSFTAPVQEPVAETSPTPAVAENEVTQAAPAEKASVKATPLKVQKSAQTSFKPDTSSTGSYILQAGVFADMANARKQQSRLAASGISAHTETKLRIGPFSSVEEVDAAREKVRASGIDAALSEKSENNSRGLFLLAGQYTDMEHAKRLQATLNEHGLPAHTETRLLVGPFATKARADAARNRVKSLNISVVLISNR